MNGCLPSIRILSFCPARQTESSMRRTVMEWQKKHSSKTFAGDFGCMLRQKKTFPRQEKGQQHIRSCDVSFAHLL